MTRIKERQKVISLRLQGKTYSEIRRETGISKSTLSDWLGKFPLTKEQLFLLQGNRKKNKELSIEKTINTKRVKREIRLCSLYKEERLHWIQLSKRELELAGIFLYWGEGKKHIKGPLSVCNTDPKIVKFALYWFKSILGIPEDKIRVSLHLYSDMSISKEMQFWSQELKLPLTQFTKPYIKESKRSELDQKGFGHGTCGLTVSDIRLKERIMMAIEAISDYYAH